MGLVGIVVVGRYLRVGCIVDLVRSVVLVGKFVAVEGGLDLEVVDHS